MGWDGIRVCFKEPEFEPEGKFQWHFDQGNVNLLRVSGEFELSEF